MPAASTPDTTVHVVHITALSCFSPCFTGFREHSLEQRKHRCEKARIDDSLRGRVAGTNADGLGNLDMILGRFLVAMIAVLVLLRPVSSLNTRKLFCRIQLVASRLSHATANY